MRTLVKIMTMMTMAEAIPIKAKPHMSVWLVISRYYRDLLHFQACNEIWISSRCRQTRNKVCRYHISIAVTAAKKEKKNTLVVSEAIP